MPRPLAPAQLDHAVQLYLSGEPIEKIKPTSGVSPTRLYRELRARGVPSRKEFTLPDEQIAAAYNAGASEYALARQYGVSRNVIARRLEQSGVQRRGPSDAGKVRVSQMTLDERRLQVAAANRAARMRTVPQLDKFRRALQIEAEGKSGSAGESLLRDLMAERGQPGALHRAVGPYNVDLAYLPVAVEVLGGGWHADKATHAERTPYILDEGWHLVMVWDHEGCSALGPGAADYLVAFVDEMRRQPPATCQYRVISGDGQLLAARGREDGEFPLVPPPRGRLD